MFDWFFEAGRPNSLEEGKLGDLGLDRWEGGCAEPQAQQVALPTDPPILRQFPPDFQELVGIQKHLGAARQRVRPQPSKSDSIKGQGQEC